LLKQGKGKACCVEHINKGRRHARAIELKPEGTKLRGKGGAHENGKNNAKKRNCREQVWMAITGVLLGGGRKSSRGPGRQKESGEFLLSSKKCLKKGQGTTSEVTGGQGL